MRRCFYHTDIGQNAVFHNFARQIVRHSIFRTIEARASFAQQIMELVLFKNEENSIMSGLFSKNNLLLCGM